MYSMMPPKQKFLDEAPNSRSPSHTYLLVSVEGVDDELHHAVDLSLEGKLLRLLSQLLHLRHTQSIQFDGLLLPSNKTTPTQLSCRQPEPVEIGGCGLIHHLRRGLRSLDTIIGI